MTINLFVIERLIECKTSFYSWTSEIILLQWVIMLTEKNKTSMPLKSGRGKMRDGGGTKGTKGEELDDYESVSIFNE